MTLASIVIPSRGGAQRLPRLLNALAAQDDQEWEAIVVVDGDIDGSEAVIEGFQHLPVRSIVFPENRGRVAALNAGFENARGEVLIRCDDDLCPSVGYVRQHKAAHATSPGGAIGLYLNQLPDTPYARAYGSDADEKFRVNAYAQTEAWRYWAGNCSTTRELWDAVGPYDPDYRAYGWEDVDWGYRLHQQGVPVRLVRELETPHFVAAVTTQSRVQRAFHSGAARRLFEAKHGAHLLSSAIPASDSLWNKAVRTIGKVPSRRILDLASTAADAGARVLPKGLSRKAIALLVEGGSVAGYRHPNDITTEF